MQYFEDIKVGQPRVTASRALSEAATIAFARKFDPQAIHVDRDMAKKSIYGGLIASGWHTAAVMMRLMVDAFQGETAGRGSPGFDDLRWLKPVRPGDSIRARITCIAKTPSTSRPDIGSCRFQTEVLNQHDEIVMTLIQIGLYGRRPASA